MASIHPIRKDQSEPHAPVNIGDRAFDNLKFIRETMERSAVFTSVPGYGGVLMGATAAAAALLASTQPNLQGWLIVWLVEAVLAFFIGLITMWQKTKFSKTSLFSAPAKKMVLNAVPPMLCGVFITLGLWRFGYFKAMVPAWILCYGAAVVCGGAFSVRVVPVMGWCFIAVGAVAFALPPESGDVMMAASFGLLHIVFGVVIGRKFGG